jgi:hypothetical protein
MKKIKIYILYFVVIAGSFFFIATNASAAMISPGEIDLYRQLGLRLEEKVDNQNALQLHCVVENPDFLKKLGMTDIDRGDKVRLTQKDKDKWLVENETNDNAVPVEATIREIYDYYKPKL